MRQVNLTTELGAQVNYTREDDAATLLVEYHVPLLQADRCREGWRATIEQCLCHELEAHEGLLRDAEETLIEALEDDADPCESPFTLRVDAVASTLAERVCEFLGDRTVRIPAGEFLDEWRVLMLRDETSDTAVARVLFARIIAHRETLMRQVFTRFGLQAEAHDRRN